MHPKQVSLKKNQQGCEISRDKMLHNLISYVLVELTNGRIYPTYHESPALSNHDQHFYRQP